jgi:hypothetical protein
MLSYPPYRPTEKFGDLLRESQQGHGTGSGTGANLGTVLVECDIASVQAYLDAPTAADPAGEFGWCGLFGGQAGDRVGVRVAEVCASRGVLGVRIHPQRSEVFRGDGMTAATRSFALSLTARREPVEVPGSRCLDERPMKQ